MTSIAEFAPTKIGEANYYNCQTYYIHYVTHHLASQKSLIDFAISTNSERVSSHI